MVGPVIGVCADLQLKSMSLPRPYHFTSLLNEIVIVTPFSSITQMSTLGQFPPRIRAIWLLQWKRATAYWPNAKYLLSLACNISNDYSIANEG